MRAVSKCMVLGVKDVGLMVFFACHDCVDMHVQQGPKVLRASPLNLEAPAVTTTPFGLHADDCKPAPLIRLMQPEQGPFLEGKDRGGISNALAGN